MPPIPRFHFPSIPFQVFFVTTRNIRKHPPPSHRQRLKISYSDHAGCGYPHWTISGSRCKRAAAGWAGSERWIENLVKQKNGPATEMWMRWNARSCRKVAQVHSFVLSNLGQGLGRGLESNGHDTHWKRGFCWECSCVLEAQVVAIRFG